MKHPAKSHSGGFTLIELLVVIAIIGILSAVVLALTSGSRTSASDAGMKAGLEEVRQQIELSFANASNYGVAFASASCPTTSSPPDPIFYTDAKILSILSNVIANNGGNAPKCATGGPATGATSWAVASPLKSLGTGGQWWCTDSTGNKKLSASNPNLGGGAGVAALCP